MSKQLLRLASGAVLILALVGCPPTTSGSVLSVTIAGGDRTLGQDTTTILTADVQTTGNASTAVTWTSSNANVASIDDDGALEARTPGTSTITAISLADATKNDAITITVAPPGALRWTRQFGTSSFDVANGIATAANGAIYVTGLTEGGLEGTNVGTQDAFVRSYNGDGALGWTRQFGTTTSDVSFAVAADANGNVYTAGLTFGDLEGTIKGDADAFVRSYYANGDLRWTRQFGTTVYDIVNGIATDVDGNVYVTGGTEGVIDSANAGSLDAFVRAYDTNGNVRWTDQFGTSGFDEALSISTDAAGNTYVAGNTGGSLAAANAGNSDAFVRSYDTNGGLRWTRQFGTSSNELTTGVAAAADGTVYVVGHTRGALVGENAGGNDVFLRSFDGNGAVRWTLQFGTSSDDRARGIATDVDGNLYVAGSTFGDLDGTNAGFDDAYVRSFDGNGAVRWTRQFGTSSEDGARGVATDADGNVYITGTTLGDLDGTNAGSLDAFVRALAP